MIHIKLLLIINFLTILYSCKNETNTVIESKKNENNQTNDSSDDQEQNKTKSIVSIQDSVISFKEDSLIKVQNTQDRLNLIDKESKEKLKVIINGKVFYKKHKDDFRLGKSYIFRTKNMQDYDIKSGGFVPSGFDTGEADKHTIK